MKIEIYIIPEHYIFEDYREKSMSMSVMYISRSRGGGFAYICPTENTKNLMTRLWKYGREWVCFSYKKNLAGTKSNDVWNAFLMSKLTSEEIDYKEFLKIVRGEK